MVLHFFFFFNDTATTEIYTLSLHDALPISATPGSRTRPDSLARRRTWAGRSVRIPSRSWFPATGSSTLTDGSARSEEHTSELQSRQYLVCRLLLEKKKKQLHRSTHQK